MLRVFSIGVLLFALWALAIVGQSKQAQESLRNWTAITASSQDAPGLENYKFLFSFPHDDIVTCAAFSRDGRWLATGSEAGTIIVVDLATQKQRKIEGVHPNGNGVNVLNFSQDGELLLTGGWGLPNHKNTGLIKILRTSDYSVVETLDAHEGHSVDFLSISHDKKWLISADETEIKVWDFAAKRVARAFRRFDGKLFFDGARTLVIGVGMITDRPYSQISGRTGYLGWSLTNGSIVFLDIIDGKITRVIRTVEPQPIRGIEVVRGSGDLVVLAQTKEGYAVQLVDGRNHTILKSTPITPYRPEPGVTLIGGRIELGLAENYHVAVYNDRNVTYLIDYNSGEVARIDHRSLIGFTFDNTGKRFAILGGINNAALTGMPSQHYWTVSVFSFDPTTAMRP